MRLTNGEIGNLITALELAILHSKSLAESHRPAANEEDAGIIAESEDNITVFAPLLAKLRLHEKAQLKKHFPKRRRR